ncbi:hypothetical protein BCR34DRAFT_589428 [Clohesyomyces aquaticus]|uniref:Peptidase C14 caspase domain-containing protein n=1 Tax=Clohesyomyces aquaticus TaxID=1231657 RepID=A0A1Y1ZHN7_9PLEO|nr:hypothetical protein BCR34DRAFT_589428 [Clohesyomyces aquaticus]
MSSNVVSLGGTSTLMPKLLIPKPSEPYNTPTSDYATQNEAVHSRPPTPDSLNYGKVLPVDLQDFRRAFDEKMQNKPVKHDQAFVLLLCWEDELDDLNIKSEFDELEEFFDQEYGFKVERQKLGREKADHQLNQFLSTFMFQYDDKDRLLIIYYGGHGVYQNNANDQYKGIAMQASTTQDVKNRLVWSKAEHSITNSRADVLVIFDCCQAGSFGGWKVRANLPHFEYIAACGPDEPAALPGPNSFTSAFMWALKDFKDKEDCPFRSVELVDKIKTKLKGQTPELQVRDRHAIGEHVWITPLNVHTPTKQRAAQGEHRHAHHQYIDLRFNFYRKVEPRDAGNVAKHLSRLVNDDDGFAKHITLMGVSSPAADCIKRWTQIARRKRSISSFQSDMMSETITAGINDVVSNATTGMPFAAADNNPQTGGEESPTEPQHKRKASRDNHQDGLDESRKSPIQQSQVQIFICQS